jgi:hypothetical protein
MFGGVKILRARKTARTRRPMSPDQYQIALQSTIEQIHGVCGYFWSKRYCPRGEPSVRIVIQLGYMCNAADAQAAVDFIFQELDEMMATLHVVVTLSVSHFMLMCAQPVLTAIWCGCAADVGDAENDDVDDEYDDNDVDDDHDVDEDDDDDGDDDDHGEDHGDDNAQAGKRVRERE